MGSIALSAGVSASARPRRVFGPAAESLSFAGPNESNQSKGPEYTFVKSVWLRTVAVFGAARSSARFLADPSSLRDFMDRKALLVDRRRSIDPRGRLVRHVRLTRSKALSADRSEFELLGKRCRKAASQSKRNGPNSAVLLNRELLLNRRLARCVFRHFALVTFIWASK